MSSSNTTSPMLKTDEQVRAFQKLLMSVHRDNTALLLHDLIKYMGIDGALIVEAAIDHPAQCRIISGFIIEKDISGNSYDLKRSPCAGDTATQNNSGLIQVDNLLREYPHDELLQYADIHQYLAYHLLDANHVLRYLILLSETQITHLLEKKIFLDNIMPLLSTKMESIRLKIDLESEKRLTKVQLDAIPALVFILDKTGNFIRWNKYYQELTGYSDAEMRTLHSLDTLAEKDRSLAAGVMKKVFKEGKGSLIYRAFSKNKINRTMYAVAERISYHGEDVLIGVATDISEQKHIEEELRQSEQLLKETNSQLKLLKTLSDRLHNLMNVKAIANEVLKIFDEISDAEKSVFRISKLIETDNEEQELHIVASKGFGPEILSMHAIANVGSTNIPSGIATSENQIVVYSSMEDAKLLTTSFKEALKTEGVNSGIIIPLSYNNEILGVVSLAFLYEQTFKKERLEFYKSVGASVSLALYNARQFENVAFQAKHDSLTTLPNRISLHDDCKSALKASAGQKTATGLLLLDLDHFKEINDTLGHHVGDALLRQIGARIETALENSQSKIYRLGGDEFSVLVPNHQTMDEMKIQAEKIQLALQQSFDVDELQLEINASIGISSSSQHIRDVHELLRCADMAMYAAKHSGSGIATYQSEMEFLTPERKAILADLSEAIKTDQLFLQYQPIWDFKTKTFVGCEALIRWDHPEYGLLFPDKFIPIVEITKMIHPMTIWVFEKVCQQLNVWEKLGLDLRVAINISTRNLMDDSCENKFEKLIKKYNISTENISLEVTETALMHDPERTSNYINNINEIGLQFSLDDFGTGHSSLTYLRKLPFQILKIDRSFVIDMPDITQNKIIVESTINLAHNLGMLVVAEGVEDKAALDELELLGCDFAQGYFLSRPLDADKFITFIQENKKM